MQGDGWLFVGFIIFIFVLWLSTGGPMRPISWSGPYITPLAGPGDVGEGYGEEPSFLSGWTDDSRGRSGYEEEEVSDLRQSIANAARFGTPSTYKDVVTIEHSVGALDAKNPDEEYFTISVTKRAPESINISGWRIQSDARNRSLTIGNGTALPRSGTVNTITPILLTPGQEAVIVTGDSPIGVSFRENMCTGYFDEFQSFTPALEQSCPSAGAEYHDYYGYDVACEEFANEVDRCSVARASSKVSQSCRAFVSQYLNYNGCVAAHSSEEDFYSNQWRIYLGEEDDFFTKEHDTIRLLDAAGNTVDLLSY